MCSKITTFIIICLCLNVCYGRVKYLQQSVEALTADNFEKLVMNPEKNVMVEFYNGYDCEVCRKTEAIYERVGELFKRDHACVLTIIDINADPEIGEKYRVSAALPHFRFYSKTDKSGEDFSGKRSIRGFTDFLNEKCGTKPAVDVDEKS